MHVTRKAETRLQAELTSRWRHPLGKQHVKACQWSCCSAAQHRWKQHTALRLTTDLLRCRCRPAQVYQKLLDAGLQPISTTYTALISAFGKAGQLDKAMETFQTMIQQGCERSVITYSALISACEKAGRWELALDLFDQMQHEGCNPNTVTYNSLITACQQGKLDVPVVGRAPATRLLLQQLVWYPHAPQLLIVLQLLCACVADQPTVTQHKTRLQPCCCCC